MGKSPSFLLFPTYIAARPVGVGFWVGSVRDRVREQDWA